MRLVVLLVMVFVQVEVAWGRREMEEEKSWCVARYGTDPITLQAGLDWACGLGGADCLQIQQGGSCYAPNTLFAHSSFAFNSYFQKNLDPSGSCDFHGAAMLINVDPSYPGCLYPSSAREDANAVDFSKAITTFAESFGILQSVFALFGMLYLQYYLIL